MEYIRLTRDNLAGKWIDCHSHAGVDVKAYACGEYPYAATIEGIYYRQKTCGIEVNVVFPYSPALYFEPGELLKGNLTRAAQPLSPAPYAAENAMLLRELYDYCPELEGHFLPFISVDPGREIDVQLRHVEQLKAAYPVYGLKIVPVACQSKVTELLDGGSVFADLARECNWPVLLHTTVHEEEEYSRADLAFEVIERYPDIRFCLAHCIGFDRHYLEAADAAKNVWVDTAALKIQCQLAAEDNPIVSRKGTRVDVNYSDPAAVLNELAECYPQTLLWGTDTPAYAYICRRKQGEGVYSTFRLKGVYEDEVLALNSLDASVKSRIANENTLAFLFGAADH